MWRAVKILSTWTDGIFQPRQLSVPFNIKNPNSVAMAAKARGVSACLPEWRIGNHTRDWIALTLRNGNERSSDLFTVSLHFIQTFRELNQRHVPSSVLKRFTLCCCPPTVKGQPLFWTCWILECHLSSLWVLPVNGTVKTVKKIC